MIVTLHKYGGQLPGLRPIAVDLDKLATAQAGHLRALVDAARTAAIEAPKSAPPAPDMMSYKITVEEGGPPLVLKANDAAMDSHFSRLLEALEPYGRAG